MSDTTTSTAETIRVTVEVDTDELRKWADHHADRGHHGVAHVLYKAAAEGESLSEQALAEARRDAGDAALRAAREDIRARRRHFASLKADDQYLNALDDAYGLVNNRIGKAASPAPTCKLVLSYFTSDDGIWLRCDAHNWEHNLGWDPSVADALAAPACPGTTVAATS